LNTIAVSFLPNEAVMTTLPSLRDLPDGLTAYSAQFLSAVDCRSYRTTCTIFNNECLPRKGIDRVPYILFRDILDYLDHPIEDGSFRKTCVRFRKYCPLNGYLNLDHALSYCNTYNCRSITHIFSHSLALDRTIAFYQRRGCKIHSLISLNHGIRDADLRSLQQHSIEVLKIAGERVTSVGLKILSQFPLKVLHFEGLQDPDEHLIYLKKLRLQELSFSSPEVSDDGIGHLCTMPLEKLKVRCYFWQALITRDGLDHLRKMPLKDLEIVYSTLSGTALHQLVGLPLKRLSLTTPLPTLSIDDLLDLQRSMPALTTIELNGNEV
jgi:hypothetical protein